MIKQYLLDTQEDNKIATTDIFSKCEPHLVELEPHLIFYTGYKQLDCTNSN